jgi:hypothetical protein
MEFTYDPIEKIEVELHWLEGSDNDFSNDDDDLLEFVAYYPQDLVADDDEPDEADWDFFNNRADFDDYDPMEA